MTRGVSGLEGAREAAVGGAEASEITLPNCIVRSFHMLYLVRITYFYFLLFIT